MPEILTKHPDTVIKVLESGGARCGQGEPQNILKACPAESFCALPGGETCVYDVAEVGEMTQIAADDLAPYVCQQSASGGGGGCSAAGAGGEALALLGVLALGFALGRRSARRRQGEAPGPGRQSAQRRRGETPGPS